MIEKEATKTRDRKRRDSRDKRLMLAGILCLLCLLGWPTTAVQGDGKRPRNAQYQEYEVKAAFIYNFLRFIDWPAEQPANKKHPIVVGVFAKLPYERATDVFKDRKIKGRAIKVRMLTETDIKTPSTLRQCHALFICSAAKKNSKSILSAVQGHAVLTIGEHKGFLESGGTINFLIEKKKIRFEVNMVAAQNAKLTIRAKLLRLACRVLTKKSSEITEQQGKKPEGSNNS